MTEDPASGADDGFGFLLDATGGLRPADLHDPATGKSLLIALAPLDPVPPRPDAMRIGIIDSGVIADHPQLRGLVVAARDFTGTDPEDRIGHGTLVALRVVESLARGLHELRPKDADLAERLAGSPALVVAKVTDAQGRIEVRHVIEAIHWVVAERCRSVNLSLGFTGTAGRYRDLCRAIAQYASEPEGGVIFAAAAGNFGPDVAVYPAACGGSNLISVGAAIDGAPWSRSGRADILADGRAIVCRPRPITMRWPSSPPAPAISTGHGRAIGPPWRPRRTRRRCSASPWSTRPSAISMPLRPASGVRRHWHPTHR